VDFSSARRFSVAPRRFARALTWFELGRWRPDLSASVLFLCPVPLRACPDSPAMALSTQLVCPARRSFLPAPASCDQGLVQVFDLSPDPVLCSFVVVDFMSCYRSYFRLPQFIFSPKPKRTGLCFSLPLPVAGSGFIG
jgi:hypothetical protein